MPSSGSSSAADVAQRAPRGARPSRGRWSRSARSRRRQPGGAPAERVDAREEARRAGRWCGSGRSTWGTCPQPSSTICSARGQPALDVALEAGRDQLVVGGPDEHRRRLQLRPGAGRSRRGRTASRGRCCAPRSRKASRAPACGRCARTRRRRCRPRSGPRGRGRRTATRTGGSTCARPSGGAARPSSGRSTRTTGCQSRRTNATAGHSRREAADAVGVLSGRPRARPGRPSSCRPGARGRSPSRPSPRRRCGRSTGGVVGRQRRLARAHRSPGSRARGRGSGG